VTKTKASSGNSFSTISARAIGHHTKKKKKISAGASGQP
jgi:hypothetical protein